MSQAEGTELPASNKEGLNGNTVIDRVDEVSRKATVSIPADVVQQEFTKALDSLQKTAHLKGFRPGKAPRHMLEKSHGPRLQFDVANRLISQSLEEIIKGMSETVIGQPQVDLSEFLPGQAITYTATMQVWPEPEIKGYEAFDVSVPQREVANDQVEQVVKKFLESKATLQEVTDRKDVQLADMVEAELIELKEGQATDQKEPFTAPVGEGVLPEELDQALLGMEQGQEKDVFLALGKSQNASKEETAEKQPNYRLLVKSIKTRIYPEVTDALIKEAKIPEIETVLEFRADILKRLESELKQQKEDDLNSAVIEKLLEQNQFQVPSLLVDDEIRNMMAQSGVFKNKDIDISKINVEPLRQSYGESAEKRVRTTIIVDSIAQKENLKAGKEDLDKHCEELADQHNLELSTITEYMSNPEVRVGTLLNMTRDRVLAFLRDRTKVSYKAEEPSV